MEKINENPPSENYKILSITFLVIGWIAVYSFAGISPSVRQDGYFSSMIFLAAIPATMGLCGVLFAETKHIQRICLGFTILAPFICYFANILIFNLIGAGIGEKYNGLLALIFQIILSLIFIYLVFFKNVFSLNDY